MSLEDFSDSDLASSSVHSTDSNPFPVPFRVLFLLLLGAVGWGANLDILIRTGVSPSKLLFPSGDKGVRPRKVYELAGALACVILGGWILFYGTGSEAAISLTYATVLILMVNPLDGCCRRERFRFLGSLKQVAFGGLYSVVSLADVLTADILTSFAKVFADLYATLCHILFLPSTRLASPGDVLGDLGSCGYSLMGPVLTSLPYGFRLRQCLAEYHLAPDAESRSRHLANALKYASAFPVIFLSAIQNIRNMAPPPEGEEEEYHWIETEALMSLWFIFVAINSIYSFWWDVKMDWALSFSPTTTTPIFSSSSSTEGLGPIALGRTRSGSLHDQLLRPNLHFREPFIYYFAVVFDLLLRLTWSLKISTHLQLHELSAGGFAMEVLEILRRWMWVYFRLEKEWVARGLWRQGNSLLGGSQRSPVLESPRGWGSEEEEGVGARSGILL